MVLRLRGGGGTFYFKAKNLLSGEETLFKTTNGNPAINDIMLAIEDKIKVSSPIQVFKIDDH